MAKDTQPTKTAAVNKAKAVAKVAKKGTSVTSHKTYTGVRFFRPNTLQLAKAPKYARTVRSHLKVDGHLTSHQVIRTPLTTEKAMKRIEDENTLVFLVHKRATKPQIKSAFQKLYNVKVRSVNTLNTITGNKKAYIRLTADSDSLTLANKIGLI